MEIAAYRNLIERLSVSGTMSVSLSLEVDKVTVVGSPFNHAGMPRERVKFRMDPALGSFEMDVIQHKYFGFGETYATFKQDVLLAPSRSDSSLYGLAIIHSELASAKFMDRDWINVKHGEYYFTHNPGVEEVHFFKADMALRMHFLEIQPGYLNGYLQGLPAERDTPLWHFKDQVSRNEFAGAGGAISIPGFYQVIQSMFNCPLSGPLGQLMLEGGLQQLMAMQFAMMGSQRQDESISKRDRELLYAVRDHLHETFHDEHSLLSLSRKFGVNQNKLKTGFRELFGAPVISYLYDLKMDHARMLLLDKAMNVSEVAPIVGYRNANHFSTAFKRKYGINPSRLKQ